MSGWCHKCGHQTCICNDEWRDAGWRVEMLAKDEQIRVLTERLAAAESREQKDIAELQRRSRECIALLERLAAAEADSARLDWLESHPLKTEVFGGAQDGAESKAWAIACEDQVTLREAIDAARAAEETEKNDG